MLFNSKFLLIIYKFTSISLCQSANAKHSALRSRRNRSTRRERIVPKSRVLRFSGIKPPPKEEQYLIVNFLTNKFSKISNQIFGFLISDSLLFLLFQRMIIFKRNSANQALARFSAKISYVFLVVASSPSLLLSVFTSLTFRALPLTTGFSPLACLIIFSTFAGEMPTE